MTLITEQYYQMICESAKYSESVGEWTIRGIAFAGNNVHDVSHKRPFTRVTHILTDYREGRRMSRRTRLWTRSWTCSRFITLTSEHFVSSCRLSSKISSHVVRKWRRYRVITLLYHVCSGTGIECRSSFCRQIVLCQNPEGETVVGGVRVRRVSPGH